jgi:undecaprenyl diphosphate synthase
MDGNGRWAKKRGKKRTHGHEEGSLRAKEITSYCSHINIKYLTLYAFSTENWKRPKLEISFLFNKLNRWLCDEIDTFMQNNIKFNYIGDISKFPTNMQNTLNNTLDKTKHNTGLTQVLALNYGSKDEIVRAIKKIDIEDLTTENFEQFLDTKDMPSVDILIRTGGEKRLSNFMLWQSAYAEIFFTDTLWPDFTTSSLNEIIENYNKRERKFGAL